MSKIGFESFVLAITRWAIYSDQDSYLDQDVLRKLVEYNPHKLGKCTWSQHIPIHNLLLLEKDRKGIKQGIWFPHTHSEKNKEGCISIVTRQRNDLFLKNIITGDEEWLFYGNVLWKRWWFDKDESPQPIPNTELHGRKFILFLRLDHCSFIHF